MPEQCQAEIYAITILKMIFICRVISQPTRDLSWVTAKILVPQVSRSTLRWLENTFLKCISSRAHQGWQMRKCVLWGEYLEGRSTHPDSFCSFLVPTYSLNKSLNAELKAMIEKCVVFPTGQSLETLSLMFWEPVSVLWLNDVICKVEGTMQTLLLKSTLDYSIRLKKNGLIDKRPCDPFIQHHLFSFFSFLNILTKT